MDYVKSLSLQNKFHSIIPGGSHTYAKGDDQYPEFMPAYIVRGKGSHVWDADGNEFIEYGSGLRSVTLGHAYPAVVDAASKQMLQGSNFIRPAVIELEAAEMLLQFVEGAEMIKFSKNGSDANNAAVKLARAFTGRDRIAVCGNQPFFSVDDWFIGSTVMNAGIPQCIRENTVKFSYNDITSLERLFTQYPGQIACVMLEAEKETPPADNFLQNIQQLCKQNGAVFILDEMITGFRWHKNGAQKYYNVTPDLSTFGKGLANGFAVSALAGKREIMRLGGLEHETERVFLLSTTHGAESHALAAAMATMTVYNTLPVVEQLWKQGKRLASGMNKAIAEHGLQNHVVVLGKPCCLVYGTRDAEMKPSQPLRTLFIQEIMKRGILASSLVVGYSHTDDDIDRTVEAVDGALGVYKKALEDGVEHYLVGRPVRPVFRRFN